MDEAADKNVEPAIVVVIKEPSWKTEKRHFHAKLFGNIRKGSVATVLIQEVFASVIGDVEIRKPIIVKITGCNSFRKCDTVHSGKMGDICKCAVAVVMEELTRAVFIADK